MINLGTNAHAAIPDVIDCLENCRGLHFVNAQDLLDTLGEISGTNPAAIPYLTKRARRDDAWSLRAAALAYYIDGRTNLLVETCQRLARKDPRALLGGQELFWFREDHALNEHLVPLLERLYAAPGLASRDQESILFELEMFYSVNPLPAVFPGVGGPESKGHPADVSPQAAR